MAGGETGSAYQRQVSRRGDGFMGQSMKGFYPRSIERRRNAAAIGLINLIYNLARYEQIVRLKLRSRIIA